MHEPLPSPQPCPLPEALDKVPSETLGTTLSVPVTVTRILPWAPEQSAKKYPSPHQHPHLRPFGRCLRQRYRPRRMPRFLHRCTCGWRSSLDTESRPEPWPMVRLYPKPSKGTRTGNDCRIRKCGTFLPRWMLHLFWSRWRSSLESRDEMKIPFFEKRLNMIHAVVGIRNWTL